MKQDTNKAFNASNEQAVLALVQDTYVKTRWQSARTYLSIKESNRFIAFEHDLPESIVNAARWYW